MHVCMTDKPQTKAQLWPGQPHPTNRKKRFEGELGECRLKKIQADLGRERQNLGIEPREQQRQRQEEHLNQQRGERPRFPLL